MKTLAELIQFTRQSGMNLEKARFMLGANTNEAKYFGIYYDEKSENWIVYKNKADGSKYIRYKGKSEQEAVNIIFDKMKEEVNLRKDKYIREHDQVQYSKSKFNQQDKLTIDDFPMIQAYLKHHQRTLEDMQCVIGSRSKEPQTIGIFVNPVGKLVIYYVNDEGITETIQVFGDIDNATTMMLKILEERRLDGNGRVHVNVNDMEFISDEYDQSNFYQNDNDQSYRTNRKNKKKNPRLMAAGIATLLVFGTIGTLTKEEPSLRNGYYEVNDHIYYKDYGQWYQYNHHDWSYYNGNIGKDWNDYYVGSYISEHDFLPYNESTVYKREHARDGYYYRDDGLYYLWNDQYYYYDDMNDDWIIYDSDYDEVWYDYYTDEPYDYVDSYENFYDSNIYEDWYEDHGYSYDHDDYDDDYDSNDSWWDDDDDDDSFWDDFFDSWDSSDTDWDSDW